MEIQGDRLQVFIELYQKEFGVFLTPQKATEEFAKLCQLYTLLYLTPFQLPPTIQNDGSATDCKPIPSTCYNIPATRKINS